MHCLAHKICLSKDLVCALQNAILFYLSADSEFLELKSSRKLYCLAGSYNQLYLYIVFVLLMATGRQPVFRCGVMYMIYVIWPV